MFMCEQKIDKVNVTQMKKKMELTYITWNKKESSYINKIIFKCKKWDYINFYYPKNKN